MTQTLSYQDLAFEKNTSLEEVFARIDVSGIGCLVNLDLKNPHKMKQKTKYFQLYAQSMNQIYHFN